jgi:hypothetical protein
VIAVNDRFAVAGLSTESLTAALQRAQQKAGSLSGAPAYQAATASMPSPEGIFGYVNLQGLTNQAYGTLRPLLAMGLALNTETAAYLDASKLPSVDALAKHLGTSVFSRSVTPEGQIVVARGALTVPQLVIGLIGGEAAAYPALKGNLPPGLQLPGLPGSH